MLVSELVVLSGRGLFLVRFTCIVCGVNAEVRCRLIVTVKRIFLSKCVETVGIVLAVEWPRVWKTCALF